MTNPARPASNALRLLLIGTFFDETHLLRTHALFLLHLTTPSIAVPSAAMDPSDVVLILGNIQGTPDIVALSDNWRYESILPSRDDGSDAHIWHDQESTQSKGPFLCLTFGQHMYSPQGWVVGSSPDSDDCDLQVAEDNQTGVSRRHFQIDVSPGRRCPRLTNLSRNAMRIHGADGTIILDQEQNVDIPAPVTIDLGQVRIHAWRPSLSRAQDQRYRANLESFHRDFMNALPRPAVAMMAPTSNIRFGLSGAVYKQEDTAFSAAGSFASVAKVKELRSGKSFAAKVAHHKLSDPAGQVRRLWESLTDEFQKLVRLRHVCQPDLVHLPFSLMPCSLASCKP